MFVRATLALSVVGFGGCAGPGGAGELFAVVETRPAEGVLPVEALYAPVEGEWTFVTGAGGETIVVRRRPDDRHGAAWADEIGTERVELWSAAGSGDVLLHAVIDHRNRALSLFRPPLVIAWPELAAGEVRESEAAMRVLDLKTGRPREGGTARRTVTYAGDERVRTPLGEHRARRIEIEFEADLNLADATDLTTLLVVDDVGVLVETRREEVRVLGVLPSVRETVRVRAE